MHMRGSGVFGPMSTIPRLWATLSLDVSAVPLGKRESQQTHPTLLLRLGRIASDFWVWVTCCSVDMQLNATNCGLFFPPRSLSLSLSLGRVEVFFSLVDMDSQLFSSLGPSSRHFDGTATNRSH